MCSGSDGGWKTIAAGNELVGLLIKSLLRGYCQLRCFVRGFDLKLGGGVEAGEEPLGGVARLVVVHVVDDVPVPAVLYGYEPQTRILETGGWAWGLGFGVPAESGGVRRAVWV